jgi:hypothetical protein
MQMFAFFFLVDGLYKMFFFPLFSAVHHAERQAKLIASNGECCQKIV